MGFLSLLSHFSGLSSYLKEVVFSDFSRFSSDLPNAVHPLLILKDVHYVSRCHIRHIQKARGKEKILPGVFFWESGCNT